MYFPDGFGKYTVELTRIGPHTTSVACLYLKDLDQIDLSALETMVSHSHSYVAVTAAGFGTRASG